MAELAGTQQPRRTRSVWTLALGLAVAGAAVQVLVAHGPAPARVDLSRWLLLALGFAVGEACVVHLQWGREAHSFGFGEIPLVIGLALVPPGQLIGARLAGAGVALLLFRRQSLLKLAFNLAQWWLGTALAVWVWQLLAEPGRPYASQSWLAALAAVLVADAVATVAIVAAIRLRGQRVDARLTWIAFLTGLLTSGGNACFALVTLDVLHVDWRGLWALVAVAAFLGFAQRAHVVLQRRHDGLERLNEFSTALTQCFEVQAAVDVVLQGVAALLNARTSELWLDAAFAGRPVVLAWEDGAVRRLAPLAVAALPAVSPLRRSWGRPRPHGDELVVHLGDGDGVIGALAVRGRLGEVGPFDQDDLRLLRALAGPAGAALVNGRLADQLREQVRENEFQALHDALTGLPNRVLFDRRLRAALDAGPVTVMLMDLDRFKEVNDTLGHAVGDELLREAGVRIRQAAPGAEVVARLGGDEFALLFRGTARGSAWECAQDVREALLHPMSMDGVTLTVDASMGVASAPEHGHDTSSLLRHADVAMYRAKQARSGVELYSPQEDEHTATRLSLVSELREAIRQDHLELWYQPKADLSTGEVTSVEALVRWRHPERGLVQPDEFIPIAEQTGLINPLTDWVLEAALTQCRQWELSGLALDVAVNISPRTLRRDPFPEQVRRSLARHKVPPSRLTLEITESAILEDPRRADAALRDVRSLGVRVSVDDFGTGYSSLANLKRLPVDEVKIDKSFITNLLEDAQDEAIVASIVQLVHKLGMVVVAEGVETDDIWQRLTDISCDTAQGYLISRPVEAAVVPALLGRLPAPRLPVGDLVATTHLNR